MNESAMIRGAILAMSIENNKKTILFNYLDRLEKGLDKDKQYCFYEDGHTGKCLGYSNFDDDEPCDYCKSCEKINTEEE